MVSKNRVLVVACRAGLSRIKEAFQKSVVQFDYSISVFWQEPSMTLERKTVLQNKPDEPSHQKHKWETACFGPSVCKKQIYTRDDPWSKLSTGWLQHYFQPYPRYMHACMRMHIDMCKSRCKHLDACDCASVHVYTVNNTVSYLNMALDNRNS